DGNFQEPLAEIALALPGGAQTPLQVPFASIRRTGRDALVFLDADENEKRTPVLLELVGTESEGNGSGGVHVHIGPCHSKSAADSGQTNLRRMAAHQLERGPLWFPAREKSPPAHAAGFFPRGGPRVGVVENHASRIGNRQRDDRVVFGRPTDLPRWALDQLTFVAAIPNLGAGEHQHEPRDSAPLRQENSRRTRRRGRR